MIKLKNVSKFYYSKGLIATGFVKVNLEFNLGEFVAITGESGSGKSTLLNVISGLDTYEEGEMYVNGLETSHYLESDWEKYRRENIGNIYQNFNLINSYTVYQNVELVLTLNGVSRKMRKEKVLSLLKEVDLLKFKNTKVSKLSGGQKQRVAIARALAKDTPIIIADEPTGNLDKKSACGIIKLLSEIAKEKLVIIVTHNYEQVEPYVTRKITMHDGKVLEDKKIRDYEEYNNYRKASLKTIKVLDKINLGIRNTFNIIPKFVLLFIVYAFIVASLMGEYSAFRKEEYENSKNGENYIFRNTDDKRIILNKKDKSAFSYDDIKKIKDNKNVDYIFLNDLLLDEYFEMTDSNETLWVSGAPGLLSTFDGDVDVGRLPTAPNEIIVEGMKSDYYLGTKASELLDKEFYIVSNSSVPDTTFSVKIVGIKYFDDDVYRDYTIYLSEEVINKIQFKTHQRYSYTSIEFMNKINQSSSDSRIYQIGTDYNVPRGEAYISEDFNYECPKNNCYNQPLSVLVHNLYFDSRLDLTVSKMYNENNINKLVNIPNYKKEDFTHYYRGIIYINVDDYNELYNKGNYQISVFVDDVLNVDEVVKYLEKNNYNAIAIKDTLVNNNVLQIIRIFKTVVTVVLVITLFFISYFVIRIILKSRNIYFSIIRMLGGTKKTSRDLLIVELFTISNLAYFTFILVLYLNRIGIFNIGFVGTVDRYFLFKDYLILYIIINLMSYLICMRYSRKIFKDSVMNTYREEV